jgi:hypothetical protein
MDKYGKYIKRIPSPDANRTTIFTTFNYAFQNYYLNDFNYIRDCIDEILQTIEYDENKLSLHVKKLIEQCKTNVEITIKEWEEL